MHYADDPKQAWEPFTPSGAEPWDLARVAHLHRRAGFGATWTQIQRDLTEGFEASLGRILRGDNNGPDGKPAKEFEETLQVMEDSARRRPSLERVVLLWLYRLVYTPFPLAEKMTLLWHNHFATSAEKVRDPIMMLEQNRTQRSLWRERFGKLLLAMLRDQAMLKWLDALENHRGDPNENLAREFLELFALGEGHYSEDDIRQVARALTGAQIEDAVGRITRQMQLDQPSQAAAVVRGVLELTELSLHDESRGVYFFPRGLPTNAHQFLTGWNNVHWVEWNWEFFPEAAIHRFLVRAYAHGEVRDGACWRTGAVLKRHGAKVAVLSEPDAGQVKVLIQKSTDEATTPSRAELEFVDQFVLPRLMDIIGREPDPEKTKQSWESGPKDSEDPATSKTDFKGKRINERMLDILLKKRESLWWTAENWRIALNCSKGTVGETYAWKVVIHGRREQEGKEREKRQQRNEGHQEDD